MEVFATEQHDWDKTVDRQQDVLDGLLVARAEWKQQNRRAPSWAFWRAAVHNPLPEGANAERLECRLCYPQPQPTLSSSELKVGFVVYSNANGTSSIKRHCTTHHAVEYELLLQTIQDTEEPRTPSQSTKRGRKRPNLANLEGLLDDGSSAFALVDPESSNNLREEDLHQVLLASRAEWKLQNRRSPSWAFWRLSEKNSLPDGINAERLECRICHPQPQPKMSPSEVKNTKGFMVYAYTNGTSSIKRHCMTNHGEQYAWLVEVIQNEPPSPTVSTPRKRKKRLSAANSERADSASFERQTLFNVLVSSLSAWKEHGRRAPSWAFWRPSKHNQLPATEDGERLECRLCLPESPPPLSEEELKNSKDFVVHYPTKNASAIKRHCTTYHTEEYAWFSQFSKFSQAKLEDQSPSLSMRSKARTSFASPATPAVGVAKRSYKRSDPRQQEFIEDFVLYLVKSFHPISTIDSPFFRRLILGRDPRIRLVDSRELREVVLPSMRDRCIERVKLSLKGCIAGSVSFDLWTSGSGGDVFSVHLNFIDPNWNRVRVCLGVVSVSDDGSAVAEALEKLCEQFSIDNRVIAIVKGDNDGSMVSTLSGIVSSSYSVLPEKRPFESTCFARIVSHAIETALLPSNIDDAQEVLNVSEAVGELQRFRAWTKQSALGAQQWRAACDAEQLAYKTIPTPIESRFISTLATMEMILEYRKAVERCPSADSIFGANTQVPCERSWMISQAIVQAVRPVAAACLDKLSSARWFITDAIETVITLAIEPSCDARGSEFDKLIGSRIRTLFAESIEEFLVPFRVFTPSKAHLVLALALDPRFKGFQLLRKLHASNESTLSLVSEYDAKCLLPMLLAVYKRRAGIQPVDVADASIFDMRGPTADSDVFVKDRLRSQLSGFRAFRGGTELSSSPLQWWKQYGAPAFPELAELARVLFAIDGSVLDGVRVFSVAGLLTELRRSRLGAGDLDALVQIAENWPTEHQLFPEDALQQHNRFANEAKIADQYENELGHAFAHLH